MNERVGDFSIDTIYTGDCVDGMKNLPDESVELVVSDVPFNIGYEYDIYEDNLAVDDYMKWSREWGEQAIRLLRHDGTLWIAIGDDLAAEVKTLFHRELGLHLRSWIIWHYTFGVNCTNKFTKAHTHLLYFTKHPKQFTFNAEAIRVPSARQLKYKDKRAAAGGRLPDDVWEFSRVCGTFKERIPDFPCQMPEKILARVIRACSNEGDLVVDPFAGSGTTHAVAKKLGRHYLGWELSPSYARLARKRVDSVSSGDPIAGDDTEISEGGMTCPPH